jgi:hypothetical protein
LCNQVSRQLLAVLFTTTLDKRKNQKGIRESNVVF